ncbi:MAG: hypothetical protein ACLPND_19685 [Candidatus Korobacteraceae bacterium]
MKRELHRQAMAKLDINYLRSVGFITEGEPDLHEKQRKMVLKNFWHGTPQRKQVERMIRRVPDENFEVLMTQLDSMPGALRKIIKEKLVYLPKNRGGRPSEFPLDVRRRAIRDLGLEYSRCDSFKEAVELVAGRYEMTHDYLRRLFKNRKRLRQK